MGFSSYLHRKKITIRQESHEFALFFNDSGNLAL